MRRWGDGEMGRRGEVEIKFSKQHTAEDKEQSAKGITP